MIPVHVIALYEHCLARDDEFTDAANQFLRLHGPDGGALGLLAERVPFRMTLLDLLEMYPALAKVGRPAWVDEFTRTEP